MTNVYAMTIMVVDFGNAGPEELRSLIEHHAVDDALVRVMSVDRQEVEWHDGHALNRTRTQLETFRELFPKVQL